MALMSLSSSWSFLTSSSLHGSGSADVDVVICGATGLSSWYLASTLEQYRQFSGQGLLDKASAFPCDDPFP
ncbi:hypothetical protein X975_18134, partial [Stegodyphus mimosarum]